MKQIRTLLALLLCVCMLPLSAFAVSVEPGGEVIAIPFDPNADGLYAVTVTKGGDPVDPLPAKTGGKAVYDPAMTVSVDANGVEAQAVDYNVFYLMQGKTYKVSLRNVSGAEMDDAGWNLSVRKLELKALAPDADSLADGEWFSFTPNATETFTFTADSASAFVEVLIEDAAQAPGAWSTYALDKEACRVGMELDYLRSLKTAIAGRAAALEQAEDTYNKALDKLDNYNKLIDLADKTGIGGEGSNLFGKKQDVYDALKTALKNGDESFSFDIPLIGDLFPLLSLPTIDPAIIDEMPANVTDLPDWLSERLQSSEGAVGEAKAKYDQQKAEQEADQARYDAGIAANPQLAALVDDNSVETASLRAKVKTDADAIMNGATALAADSGMKLVAADWQNDTGVSAALEKGKTYVVHALTAPDVAAPAVQPTTQPDTGVDKSALQDAIDRANALDLSKFDTSSVNTLRDALDHAKDVLSDENASQEDVTNAVNSLRDAIAGLKENPTSSIDKSALEDALNKYGKIDKDSFTPETIAALVTAATEAARVKADPNADQASVDAATKKLNDAINALVKKDDAASDVDKSGLQQLVDMIDKMDRSKFTDESLATLDKAQNNAKAVLANDKATQSDVDKAMKDLSDAQNGLKLKPATDANRTALQEAIDKAEAVDRSKYTDDSLKALDRQLEAAKAAMENPAASQAAILLAARRLTAAMNNLQDKSAVEPIHFVDVPDSAYYAEPVAWAVRNGITDGTDETHFSPKDDCTRAQIVTFLWRSLGKPEPISTANPFVDVQPGAYYYDAVLWAIGEGITDGTDATHFSPKDSCTRAHAVTFLWRMEGKPASGVTSTGFEDVPANAYYADAVRWAVANQITDGTTETTFSPKVTCSRAQIVTFLYRDRA